MKGMLDINPYLEKLGKFSEIAAVDMKSLMTQEATLAIWNSNPKVPGVINISAPFSDRAKDGASALAAGRLAARRDLGGVFSPVTLKGTRTITKVFGKPLSSPVTIRTKERWPNVQGIRDERWKRKNETHAKRATRGRKQPFYVDQSKLVSVLRRSYDRIGVACACWWEAGLDARLKPRGVPSFVTRHKGAPGSGTNVDDADSIRITIRSSLTYNGSLGMLEKMDRVLGYRDAALARRLPYVIAAIVRKTNQG